MNTIVKRYYPALSNLIDVDDLPDFLDFAKDSLGNLLSRIYYKNLQYSKSLLGDSAFYQIDIISKNIGLDLPLGFRLVLNPDIDGDSTISSFPVSLNYTWQILSYLRAFEMGKFSVDDPSSLFSFALQIFKITDKEVIAIALNHFVSPLNATISVYDQLLNDINTFYPDAGLTIPVGQSPSPTLITQLIADNANITKSVPELILFLYLLESGISSGSTDNIEKFFKPIIPDGLKNFILDIIEPKVKVSLALNIGLDFPVDLLKPVNQDGTPNNQYQFSSFIVEGVTFTFDSESGLNTSTDLSGSLVPDYAEIGDTGIVISFKGGKLDLSSTSNIPEATAAGYPVDFMGLYIKETSVNFTKLGQDDTSKESVKLTAENLFIGTGGVSGTITLSDQGLLYRKFGDFAVELDLFSLTFKMGSIVSSEISGKLTITGFKNGDGSETDATIAIDVHIMDNGEFTVTAKPLGNPFPIVLPNVFELDIRSLTLGNDTKGLYLEVSGVLNFLSIQDLPVIGDSLPKGIEIEKFKIWADGSFEFHGGGLTVPKSFKLSIGPVNLEVSHISVGTYTRKYQGTDRDYRYFGFDGGINAGVAGFSAQGNGIKYYFTVDHKQPADHFLSIDSIEVDLTIPQDADEDDAMVIIHGRLGMSNPASVGSPAATEYIGAVSVKLPSLKIAASAAMKLTPSIPAFVVDIGLELPVALPLGATGLGIYGFRGLVADHYQLNKSDTETWYQFYKRKTGAPPKEGVTIDKFVNKPGFALGAGMSIGTEFDSGYTFSAKVFVMLGLPFVLLIEGQAGVLRSRLGIDDPSDPPFYAVLVLDKNSFQAAIGVDYQVPAGGDIFELSGRLELAFFFNNASGWYLNIGKDQPESDRIKAKILSLFNGYAYLMISSQGIRAGAGAHWGINANFVIAAVKADVGADLAGFISFKPMQIGGSVSISGSVDVRIFCFHVGGSIGLVLSAEAPHPFNLTGTLKVTVKLLFVHKSFNVTLSWTKNNDNSALVAPIPILSLPDPSTGYMPASASNIMSSDRFTINYVNQEFGDTPAIPAPGTGGWQYNFLTEGDQVTIPLDSFIDIELLKPVLPGSVLGGAFTQLPAGYQEVLPPKKGKSAQFTHQFALTDLKIYSWSGSEWKPYNVFKAISVIAKQLTDGGNAALLDQLKPGYWQLTEPNKFNKIRIMSQNMFNYLSQGSDSAPNVDGLNFKPKDIFCYDNVVTIHQLNWHGETADAAYPEQTPGYVDGVEFRYAGVTATPKSSDGTDGNINLYAESRTGTMTIDFPESVADVNLVFGANQNNISIAYYRIGYLPILFGRTIPWPLALGSKTLAAGTDNATIGSEGIAQIDRIVLTFNQAYALDYEGDLSIGGYYGLDPQFLPQGVTHAYEAGKTLLFVSWFNGAFSQQAVPLLQYSDNTHRLALWKLNTTLDSLGQHHGLLSGAPGRVAGFVDPVAGSFQAEQVFEFASGDDALIIPYNDTLKVENGDFSVEATVAFGPFSAGVSTILSKVNADPASGYRKGFALHLYHAAQDPAAVYTDEASVPTFSVIFSSYTDLAGSALTATGKFTMDCASQHLEALQYKHIFVSVNRAANTLDIYIDRVLALSQPVPATLSVANASPGFTWLNSINYKTDALQRRIDDFYIGPEDLGTEVDILNNALNKTIQPVWRPNTTFAIAVSTRDVVDNNAGAAQTKTHVFGFKTMGPVGHFHQYSQVYKDLAAKDQAGNFRLADLKDYIDYDRSFPDAKGRFNLSKPVFYNNPQIKLFFSQPTVSAMYANWDSYNDLPAIQSSLETWVCDPYQQYTQQELVMDQPVTIPITADNLNILPVDQQLLWLLSRTVAAAENPCAVPDPPKDFSLNKTIQTGSFSFPAGFLPNRLYTAIFRANFTPNGGDASVPDNVEVHRYSFMTSRYPDFGAQVKSFLLDATPGSEKYALVPVRTAFTQAQIDTDIKPLLNSDPNYDPLTASRYTAPFDRLLYGGLQVRNLATADYTIISPVINTDPGTQAVRILAVLVYNPEPFNDPKLPADQLNGTAQLMLPFPAGAEFADGGFLTYYSQDNSGVLFTNAAMDLPEGAAVFRLFCVTFNGVIYQREMVTTDMNPVTINKQL